MKIIGLRVTQQRLSTAEAELHVTVETDDAKGELRGRLTGPRCPHAETIELAYPLKLMPDSRLLARVIVPEPNLWTAEMPFTYHGVVELAEGDTVHDRRTFEVRFKSS